MILYVSDQTQDLCQKIIVLTSSMKDFDSIEVLVTFDMAECIANEFVVSKSFVSKMEYSIKESTKSLSRSQI